MADENSENSARAASENSEQAARESDVIDFNDEAVRLGDHIVRGTAADGQVRAFAVTARASVQELHERHQTSPVVSAALGRLLMAGMMMGAMSKNDDEFITLVIRGEGPVGGLTVTANNRGQAKGFANHPHVWLPLNSAGKLSVGEAVAGENHTGTLSVVHDLPGMEPYSSEVPLVSGEMGTTSRTTLPQATRCQPRWAWACWWIPTRAFARRAGLSCS